MLHSSLTLSHLAPLPPAVCKYAFPRGVQDRCSESYHFVKHALEKATLEQEEAAAKAEAARLADMEAQLLATQQAAEAERKKKADAAAAAAAAAAKEARRAAAAPPAAAAAAAATGAGAEGADPNLRGTEA
jgi:hypothetical protein